MHKALGFPAGIPEVYRALPVVSFYLDYLMVEHAVHINGNAQPPASAFRHKMPYGLT